MYSYCLQAFKGQPEEIAALVVFFTPLLKTSSIIALCRRGKGRGHFCESWQHGPVTKPVRPLCGSGMGEATKKGSGRCSEPGLLGRAVKDRDGAANGGGGRKERKGEEGCEGRCGGTDIIQHTETCQDGIYFCSVREYNRALPALSIAVLK